jgi:hypothetical protein
VIDYGKQLQSLSRRAILFLVDQSKLHQPGFCQMPNEFAWLDEYLYEPDESVFLNGQYEPPEVKIDANNDPIYDQDFFLRILQKGYIYWNYWRKTNPKIPATFAGVTFKDWSHLERYNFGDDTDFSGATFGTATMFIGARFGAGANFQGATFGRGALFADARFGGYADFSGAVFGDEASFSNARFADHPRFFCTTFGSPVSFTGASFGDYAQFTGVTLGLFADFSDATFLGDSKFNGCSADEWTRWMGGLLKKCSMQSWSDRKRDEFIAQARSGHHRQTAPDTLAYSTFKRASFEGAAEFSRRRIINPCSFAGVTFNQPPVFDDCAGLDNVDFSRARVAFSQAKHFPGFTTNEIAVIQLRRLRRLAEESKSHNFERALFVEELRAQHAELLAHYKYRGWHRLLFSTEGINDCLWLAFTAGYRTLSDYGRSFVRPAVALLISIFAFKFIYGAMLDKPSVGEINSFDRAVLEFSIANSVPFIGASLLDRDTKATMLCRGLPSNTPNMRNAVSCPPPRPLTFLGVTIVQSVFSTLCIFLALLALRNYFKVS